MPLVSIVIPTYNRAVPLERALLSALGQTIRDRECIVVDDGSTDGTEESLRSRGLLNDVRYIRFPRRRGVSAARNAGAAAATGSWLAFLDSDDEWRATKLERQMRWHAHNPSYRISQTQEIWVRRGRRVNAPVTHEKKDGYIFEESLARCMITSSSVVLDAALFRELGGFNESFPACEDYDLWLRITCRLRVGLIDEYLLTRYGGHPDQLSASVPALDRFRVQSILDILASGRLSAEQAGAAKNTLVKKARILADGCKKRGNNADHERYSRIAETFSA